MRDLWALVLAGGDGRRLQGLTERITGRPIPKQYCPFLGPRSLLESTLDRIEQLVPLARTMVIVNRDHLPLAEPQLARMPRSNVIVQAANRDTGPGLTLGVLALSARCPDALVAVLPSDHYVQDEPLFLRHVARAADIVARLPDRIALLGMVPEHADTSLGYIETSDPVAEFADAFHVALFREKPEDEEARRIIAKGGLWNSFVMVFRVDRMLELLLATRRANVVRLAWCAGVSAPRDDTLPAWNFSRDFLAHVAEHLIAVPVADVGWSDWGTPEAIERTFAARKEMPQWLATTAA